MKSAFRRLIFSNAALRLPCVIMAPRGAAVVPDVYSSKARSASDRSTGAVIGLAAATIGARFIASATSVSPHTSNRAGKWSALIAPAMRGATCGSVITHAGSALASTARISSSPQTGMIGAITAPSIQTAWNAAVSSGELGSKTSTRSPVPVPWSRKTCASLPAWASSSTFVSTRSS